jgi:transcriptional regulator GlxA family with amidase domain
VHIVIYLPFNFYSAIASTIVETFQAVTGVNPARSFSFEFISKQPRAVSKSGIIFPTRRRPSRKMDILFLLAGVKADIPGTLQLLDEESARVKGLIDLARKQQTIIAATCGATWLLASAGLLDGRRATISWWLKKEARRRFPDVQWEPSRIVVRDGRIYTSGGAFSGIDLIMTMLIDLGLSKEEHLVRKRMVLPPTRELQSPYEIPDGGAVDAFEQSLNAFAKNNMRELSLKFLARKLGMSPRTLARRFSDELKSSPGKWIQEKRLDMARTLLAETTLRVSEVCYRVGYQDPASFSRLFIKTTEMSPGEFRKQIQ